MKSRLSLKQLILMAGDVVLIIASFYLAHSFKSGIYALSSLGWPVIIIVLIFFLVFFIFDLYNLDEDFKEAYFIIRFLIVVIITNIVISTLFFFINVRPYAISVFVSASLLISGLCLLWRLIYTRWLDGRPTRVLVIGGDSLREDLYRILSQRGDIMVLGREGLTCGMCKHNPSHLEVGDNTGLLSEALAMTDMVVVESLHKIDGNIAERLMAAKLRGVSVFDLPAFYEHQFAKLPIKSLDEGWFIRIPLKGVENNLYNAKLKRGADIAMSICGLLLTLPLLLAAMLAIKCESRGPVFYIHRRVGRNGRPFRLIKLRTMETGTENNREYAGRKDDPRITKVGRVLRFFRIDEIPQMWNVIKGDMSLIGPRALIEEEVKTFAPEIPFFSLRHIIRPGITGWAQVHYHHGATLADAMAKLEYDLFYIKNLSPLLDLVIMAKTIRTVLFGRGAR